MAGPIFADRVQESSTTTGTGTYTLGGATTGFQAWSVVGNANTAYYMATDGTNWEVGLGTYTLSGTTLARTTILASSNSNAAVSWSAGTRTVSLVAPATYYSAPILGGILTTNGQVQFPATQNPSTNANMLDDYEEGTATISINFGGASTGVTYAAQIASYVKVGQLVMLWGQLSLTSKGTSTGTATLSGAPFTSLVGTVGSFAGAVAFFSNMTSVTLPQIMLPGNSTTFNLYNNNAVMTDANFTNSTGLYFQCHYRASA